MQNNKLKELRQAAERARKNFQQTNSDVAYKVWQRLKEQIKKEEAKQGN